ncbi:hypothetical protein ACG7TL_008466 [Trametes sanguinea]
MRLELFDTDGERLVYAGTFLIHKGPGCCGLQNLPNAGDGVVEQLPQRTFNPASKSQRHRAKTYLPVLRDMYMKGEATLQVLGLQRVGFNTKFFEILRRAYVKCGKTRARARSETARSVSLGKMPSLESLFGNGRTASGSSGKRARVEEAGSSGNGADGGGDGSRPSKVRKLYESLDF